MSPSSNRVEQRERVTDLRALRLPGGARIVVRPLHPHDAGGYARAYSRLSAQSRRRRFLSVADQLSPADLRRLTRVDHRDHEALVALDADSGEIIGSARYLRLRARPADAELAVEVIDEWQRRGVGRILLEALSARARSDGIERFRAIVSRENVPAQIGLRRAGAVGQLWGSELEYVLDLQDLAAAAA